MNYSHHTPEELAEVAKNAYMQICEFHERCARGHATEEDENAYEVATRTYQSAVYYLNNN